MSEKYGRYEIQSINSGTDGLNYRITDKHNDDRIATCYDKEHAAIICNALNYYENRNNTQPTRGNNEQIIKAVKEKYRSYDWFELAFGEEVECALNLARQDEREKMQGVDVWVSWDEVGFEYPIVTIKQPIQNTFTNGEVYYTGE